MTGSRSRRARSPKRVGAAVAVASTLVLGTALSSLSGGVATASSHREAPLISADPTVDNTDVYAFVSPDAPDTVTFVADWFGLQEPNGGPTFYPWATDANYDINIDTDGNAKPDVGYRLTFRTEDRRGNDTFLYNNGPVTSLDDENLLFRQYYTLSVARNGGWEKVIEGQVAPSQLGKASIPNYGDLRDQAIKDLPGGGKVYVGAAEDPFFADLRVFDLLYGGDLAEVGQDTLAATNVNTWALQLPLTDGDRQRRSRPQPGDRRLERHRAVFDAARTGQGHSDGRPGAGVPVGQPAGQRGRAAGRSQGRVQRADPEQGRHHPRGRRPGDRPRAAQADRGDLRRAGACGAT